MWSPTDSNTASFLGIFIRQKDLRVSSACHSRGHLSHFTHLITLLKSIRCLPKRQRRLCQLATRNSQRPLAMSVIPLCPKMSAIYHSFVTIAQNGRERGQVNGTKNARNTQNQTKQKTNHCKNPNESRKTRIMLLRHIVLRCNASLLSA